MYALYKSLNGVAEYHGGSYFTEFDVHDRDKEFIKPLEYQAMLGIGYNNIEKGERQFFLEIISGYTLNNLYDESRIEETYHPITLFLNFGFRFL